MGGSGGPDYVTEAAMVASNKARAFLGCHYEVVNEPLEKIGWQLGANTTLKI